MSKIVVAALYHFVSFEKYVEFRLPLLEVMKENNIKGTLILAKEGINGTVAGSQDSIDALIQWLKQDAHFSDLKYKLSYDETMPFYRTKVKLKKEIVTMGIEGIDPNKVKGTYIKPQDWNELISDPDVTLIDTRNDYEIKIGSFKHAVNPETTSFREFPDYVKTHYTPAKHKKVAMFCTGGIRCEKSTAFLKEQGFTEVYHLEGGILKYLEEVPEEESLWQGECFVFDNRVSVNHSLEKGQYDQCHACRMPITQEEKLDQRYEGGISCPHCYESLTEKQRLRFAEREKQVKLAINRGEEHIGGSMTEIIERRKKQKSVIKASQNNQPKN